ncbi:unnamed protein product, partial [Meganyctiphanes norvegica]
TPSFLSISRDGKSEKSPLRRRRMSGNKENDNSPYYSPSHSLQSKPRRSLYSPLKETQNICHRSLNFSPFKKEISPSKRFSNTPLRPSPPEDFDTASQDSGYSSEKKT